MFLVLDCEIFILLNVFPYTGLCYHMKHTAWSKAWLLAALCLPSVDFPFHSATVKFCHPINVSSFQKISSASYHIVAHLPIAHCLCHSYYIIKGNNQLLDELEYVFWTQSIRVDLFMLSYKAIA